MIVAAVLLGLLLLAGAWLYAPDKQRAALEAVYAAPPSTFVEVAGLRLHLRDTGPRDAPAVILLHGYAASLHTWEDWATALSGEHRVIRFDLPGFGLTGPDPTGDYSDTRSIAVLAALMDRLGVARAAVVGNSMGGRIAWAFALRHPGRVSRLVLVAPDGFAAKGFEYGKPYAIPAAARLLPYVLPTVMLRATLAPTYGDRSRLTDAVVARYRDMMLAPGVRRAILDRLAQVLPQDPVPLLRRVATPTLLLWGERDTAIPFSRAQDFLAALPDATLAALPGRGHVPQEEAPAESLAPVRAFLAR